MLSIYDDIFSALEEHEFSIPNVTVREPYDESPKTYPAIVVHEITTRPVNHGTVNGETRTRLAYQLDIHTQNAVDNGGNVLSRWKAGRLLNKEVSELLDERFKITRRMTYPPEPIGQDVLQHIWRGDCVVEGEYVYRR